MAPAFVPSSSVQLSTRGQFTGTALQTAPSHTTYTCAHTSRVRMIGEAPADETVLEPETADGEEVDVAVCEPPQYVLNAQAIADARAKAKIHETDSGSPEFQIATLSTRITYLTNHLKQNPKDHSSTRGLLQMVAKRRRLLKYLKREDPMRFDKIIDMLGIRVSQQLRAL